MSELANENKTETNFRLRLLATASAIAFIGAVFEVGPATASGDDGSHPTFWIELGGRLSQQDAGQETFAPELLANRPAMFSPPQKFEGSPRYSFDESGAIAFEPTGSNWIFSASVQYGRVSNGKHIHEQTHPASFVVSRSGSPIPSFPPLEPKAARFADTLVRNDESHAIVDFQAGKDVGLGIFGERGSSVLGLGVRFAQFQSKSNIALKSDPDWQFAPHTFFGLRIAFQTYHSNFANLGADRSFHGVGPSLSWKASEPLSSSNRDSGLALDWGMNVAVLFGRQRAKVSHQQTGHYHGPKYASGSHVTVYHPTPVNIARVRTVTVPDVGGFAGASWHVRNFKMSLGYRADFFFGAMDGGIDTAKSYDRNFYGPFATISIGLGG